MAGWLEGTVVGGSGAAVAGGLAGALVGLGIPKDRALKYETDLEAGKFVVLVTGTDEDVSQVQHMLQNRVFRSRSQPLGLSKNNGVQVPE